MNGPEGPVPPLPDFPWKRFVEIAGEGFGFFWVIHSIMAFVSGKYLQYGAAFSSQRTLLLFIFVCEAIGFGVGVWWAWWRIEKQVRVENPLSGWEIGYAAALSGVLLGVAKAGVQWCLLHKPPDFSWSLWVISHLLLWIIWGGMWVLFWTYQAVQRERQVDRHLQAMIWQYEKENRPRT